MEEQNILLKTRIPAKRLQNKSKKLFKNVIKKKLKTLKIYINNWKPQTINSSD